MNRKKLSLLLAGCAVMMTTGCGGGKPSTPTPAPPPPTPPIEATAPAAVCLYMDNSVSMAGYTADVTYINALTKLVNVCDSTTVLKCADSYEALDKSKGNIIEQVKNLTYGKSSLLQDDLDHIVETYSDGTIDFYVTDGILSGKSTDISNNRQWTLQQAAQLKLSIEKTFTKARQKGLGVSVYQFMSLFNGTYYCYTNIDNVNIKSNRYFYVIAIGKPGVLLHFKENSVGKEFFQPTAAIHILGEMPLRSPVISEKAQMGKFDAKALQNQEEGMRGMLPVIVKAGVLAPMYTTDDIQKLADSVRVSVGNTLQNNIRATYDRGNNAFTFLIQTQGRGDAFDIKVDIPYNMPEWVNACKQFDPYEGDLYMKDKNLCDSRTFMLEHLIGGIVGGMTGDEALLYSSTMHLEKQ